MNQALYLIGYNFFENSEKLTSVWKNKIEENKSSEKLIFVFDPICQSFFKDISHDEKALKQLVMEYYHFFEGNWKAELKWTELDSRSIVFVEEIHSLMASIDWKHRAVCAYGCIPVFYDKLKTYLFFHINPGLVEDKFYMISDKDFFKNYQLIIDTKEMTK